jgi:hypothetical protein
VGAAAGRGGRWRCGWRRNEINGNPKLVHQGTTVIHAYAALDLPREFVATA